MLKHMELNIPPSTLKHYNLSTLSNLLKLKLSSSLESEWITEVKKQPKLRTYRTFKTLFKFEPYLCQVGNKNNKICLTKLRTSNHHLEIERGRYNKVPPENRLCIQCNQGAVEDELHFLLVCPKFADERRKFLDFVFQIFPNTESLQTDALFVWLMSAENVPINKKLSHFVRYCTKSRINVM